MSEALKQNASITTKESEVENLQKQLETLKKENEALKSYYSQLEGEKEKAVQNEAQAKKSIEELTQNYTDLQKNLSGLQEKLDATESENANLSDNLSELQKKMHLLREEKEQLAKEKEELQTALNRLEESMEQQTAEEEHTQDSVKSQEEPKQTQDKVEQSQEAQAPEHEKSHEIPIQRETLHAEAEHPAGQKDDKTKQEESHPETEQTTASATQQPEQPHHSDVLEAYQEMKTKLEESTLHYPYTRITSETDGCQYIYESRTLQLKAELFIWGVEGKEVILDETHFIPYNEIANIEGLESPFATEAMECDFSEDGNGEEVAEALLMAICCYHPVHITYRDKTNGRISERNLYWICFQPQGVPSVRLPYDKIFRDMFDGEIDTDHIMAMCAHSPVPRTFIINQILNIQVYDAFVTTRKGVDTQIDGMYYAVLASQPEAADMIYQCLPQQFKKLPSVISYRAHYWMLEGDYQKAMKLYLSFTPDTEVANGKTWAAINTANFDEFIRNDVEAERFSQLKEALREEGWAI